MNHKQKSGTYFRHIEYIKQIYSDFYHVVCAITYCGFLLSSWFSKKMYCLLICACNWICWL